MSVDLFMPLAFFAIAILAFAQGFGFIKLKTKPDATEDDVKKQKMLIKLSGVAMTVLGIVYLFEYI